MSFFQAPPPTRYDLNFTLFGFSIRVHPLFWIIAILFGTSTGTIPLLLIWVIAVFVSILIHELGHSLAMRLYGVDSYIVLHGFGGLAIPTFSRRGRGDLSPAQQVFISFAGPLAGFLLAGLILAVVAVFGGLISTGWLLGFIPVPNAFLPGGGSLINGAIRLFLWVNVFWGLINLVPVFPLDGGQIARHILSSADPWNGMRNSLWVSVIAGALMAVAGLVLMGSIYIALLFGILAFQSYQMLRGSGGRLY
ncbi:MAG: hypothetical protein QNJ45_23275 [Ardenticatenaceae bacterium]|nr:hypothetical protein [Ardenticatenaceae bacterium]